MGYTKKASYPIKGLPLMPDKSSSQTKLTNYENQPLREEKCFTKTLEGGFSIWRNPLLTKTQREGFPERCWS